jgi:hypothetical protein
MSVNDYDEGSNMVIEDLVDAGKLEKGTPAYGVSRQVIHVGLESLTPKQRALYDAMVVPLLVWQAEKNEAIRLENSTQD